MSSESTSWSARLLAEGDSPTVGTLALRVASASALSAAYGLAVGVEEGGVSLVTHAVSVPVAVAAALAIGVPALFIALALLDAPVRPRVLTVLAIRGWAACALLLGGLAPAAALFAATSQPETASTLGALGLFVGGVVGLLAFGCSLSRAIGAADTRTRILGRCVSGAFAVFSVVFAGRVLGAGLALLGGS
jgi:hypothetical protein